jgi:hypothetical protein
LTFGSVGNGFCRSNCANDVVVTNASRIRLNKGLRVCFISGVLRDGKFIYDTSHDKIKNSLFCEGS